MKNRQIQKELYRLVGTPFNVLDCFDLVRKCYEIQHGVNIPPPPPTNANAKLIFSEFLAQISANWHKCEKKVGVCVAMAMHPHHPKLITHFGYMLDEGHIIHSLENTGVVIQRLSELKGVIRGYYEYK